MELIIVFDCLPGAKACMRKSKNPSYLYIIETNIWDCLPTVRRVPILEENEARCLNSEARIIFGEPRSNFWKSIVVVEPDRYRTLKIGFRPPPSPGNGQYHLRPKLRSNNITMCAQSSNLNSEGLSSRRPWT